MLGSSTDSTRWPTVNRLAASARLGPPVVAASAVAAWHFAQPRPLAPNSLPTPLGIPLLTAWSHFTSRNFGSTFDCSGLAAASFNRSASVLDASFSGSTKAHRLEITVMQVQSAFARDVLHADQEVVAAGLQFEGERILEGQRAARDRRSAAAFSRSARL